MRWITPLPRSVTRPVSIAILIGWVATMAVLINRSYLQATSSNLASDLARYGSGAQWRGVYYRGEKIGFTVSQTVPLDDGFELQEDGRLQMTLLGATTAARVRTTARVDRSFTVRSFEFTLDPGTGAVAVRGAVTGSAVDLTVTTRAGSHTERRVLPEPPVLSLNVGRRLAAVGIRPGLRHELMVFDPATLRNAPMILTVGQREVVRREAVPIPAFRVEMDFSGLRTTSWITDTGEIIREESPMGMITMRESPEQARAMAVPGVVQMDLLRTSAVVPRGRLALRIDNPRDIKRLRLRVEGVPLAGEDLQGVGQSVTANVVELRDPRELRPGAIDTEAGKYLAPEAFIESDAPEIRAEALAAVQTAAGPRARAERLTRHVNAILEKKPTVSLPSAREVLRTRVGDCNEHTALYVAMARSLGIPSRIAVGLTVIRRAFYYHAWPEVYIEEDGRGMWLPVDPTLNQFPADATHFRIARGGLDRQAAIIPLIGKMRMTVLDLELAPGTQQVLVGPAARDDMLELAVPIPRREAGGCWYLPARRR